MRLGIFGICLVLAACGGTQASHEAVAARPAIAAPTLPPGLSAATVAAETGLTRACNNREYLPAVLSLINGARSRIDVSQFLFVYGRSTRLIQEALVAAAARGVKVRVLVDEESDRSMTTVEHLVRLGVTARADSPRKRTHTKMVLVDGEWVLAGSTNWSDASLERNNESNLLVHDPAIAGALERYYAALWEKPDDDAVIEPVTSNGITVVCDRAYETVAMTAIAESDSIDLHLYAARWYAESPESPSSAAILAVSGRARAGRPVRAIVEESDYNQEGNAFNNEVVDVLRSGGVRIRRDPMEITSHTKLLITDRLALMGSTNWGFGAFRRYHELNFLVTDPRVAGQFRDYFHALWDAAQPELSADR